MDEIFSYMIWEEWVMESGDERVFLMRIFGDEVNDIAFPNLI